MNTTPGESLGELEQRLAVLVGALRQRDVWPPNMRATCVHKHWNWISEVRKQPEYDGVLNLAEVTLANRRRLRPDECASWLAWAATQRGPKRAVEDAAAAIDAPTIVATATVVLAGPTMAQAAALDPQTAFMNFKELPWSFEKIDYEPAPRRIHDGYRVVGPTAALHTTQSITWEEAAGFPVDETLAEDFVRCLVLAARRPAVILVSWQQYGLDVPLMRTSSFIRRTPSDIIHPPSEWKVTKTQQEDAVALWTRLRAFDPGSVDRLRVALDRLTRAELLSNSVSKAIDAGVAAEAMLVEGDERNRRQVGQKSAWLLAPTDSAHRATLERTMKQFYDLRSVAVHTGKVPREDLVRGIPRVLVEAMGHLVSVARAVLLKGSFPSWRQTTQADQTPAWEPT